MKNTEIITLAKSRLSEIAKATKSLWSNDAYRVVFMWNSEKNEYTVSKVQRGWTVGNDHIYFSNCPMTKKEVLARIEEVEYYENQLKEYGMD